MESDFSVSFINVGSADCTLIKCGDKSVLIDGGTNLVTDKITAYLKRSSVTHLDAVIVSHPDSDHIGSLPDIMMNSVQMLFISENIPTTTKPQNTKSLLIL